MKSFQTGLCALLLCLPLLATHAQTGPDLSELLNILEGMAEGDWARVNLNRFEEVFTPPELRELIGPSNPEPYNILTAWSSFAWDPNRGDILIFGGGHANYANNDVYRWRATTRRWERAALPSALEKDCLGYWQPVDGPDNAPVSSHTYDNNIFLPIVDRFVTFGGAAHAHGGSFVKDVNCTTPRATGPYFFDPSRADPDKVGGSTGSHVQREGSFDWVQGGYMWENRDVLATIPGDIDFPSRFVDGATGYTQENGKDVVYVSGFSGGGTATALYKYTINSLTDPSQDTWEQVGRYWSGLSGEGSGAYLPTLHAFVRIASSRIGYWDLSTAGPDNNSVIITLDDPTASYTLSSHDGLEYDASRERFLIWGGQEQVWALYPPAELGPSGWRIEPQPAPSGIAPTGSDGTGVLGKWNYISNLDAFLGIQAIDGRAGNVWLYKPVGWQKPNDEPLIFRDDFD